MSRIPVSSDKLLSELVVVMDQSDVEYGEIIKELKAEMFSNRCCQERLGEHLWWLEKEKGELDTEKNRSEVEEKGDLEEKLCRNLAIQEEIREQLQGLEKRLRTVEATVNAEEFLQDKANEVGCVQCEWPMIEQSMHRHKTVGACVTLCV